VTSSQADEIVDRCILGNEVVVRAAVDLDENAVPWERMERQARQQGMPLSANTLASAAGKVIGLFGPIVGHIFSKVVCSLQEPRHRSAMLHAGHAAAHSRGREGSRLAAPGELQAAPGHRMRRRRRFTASGLSALSAASSRRAHVRTGA
jgi:hypothetical protein